ncbi:MAG: hypothetical protein JXR49_08875 [Acidobacteria bacterium]|nr:hypothetical protein [Acidobacteriota bacterium]
MNTLNAFTTSPGGFMKKTCMLMSFVAVLAAMAIPASAGSAIMLHGDIPFDFYVGDQMLPSGEYDFEMGGVRGSTASSITVREKDGTIVAFVTTRPGDSQNMDPSQLSFKNCGGKYFLASVECSGHKAVLRETKRMHQTEIVHSASVLPAR